jgi:hypothetical protein
VRGEAALAKRNGGRQSTDSAADDEYREFPHPTSIGTAMALPESNRSDDE